MLKRFEGLELEAYQDIAGIWTIGFGHTGDDVQPGMKISGREAEDLLRRDLRPREDAVERLVRVPLNQNEFDALVSFVYNVGIGAFEGSTARRRLNKGDRMGAADALTWWNKATVSGVLRPVTGLTRRRAAERALFLTPTNPTLAANPERFDDNTRVTPVEEPPRRPNIAESRTIQGAVVAGGAGAAASTMGRDNVDELDQLETNIESGAGMTADAHTHESNTLPSDEPDTDETDTDDTPDATIDDNGDVIIGDGDGETLEEITMQTTRPSKHEVHQAESQIQLALLILVVLAVLYIVFARVEDWFNYKR